MCDFLAFFMCLCNLWRHPLLISLWIKKWSKISYHLNTGMTMNLTIRSFNILITRQWLIDEMKFSFWLKIQTKPPQIQHFWRKHITPLPISQVQFKRPIYSSQNQRSVNDMMWKDLFTFWHNNESWIFFITKNLKYCFTLSS